jgi:hypothetical protein
MMTDDAQQKVMRMLPDEQFRVGLYAAAQVFSMFKKEAERRGIWQDIVKNSRVQDGQLVPKLEDKN